MTYEKPRILEKPEKLKPCPFCGSPARMNITYRFGKKLFVVECSKAHPLSHVARVKSYDQEKALRTWNGMKVSDDGRTRD